MKRDMSGSAAVLCAFDAIVRDGGASGSGGEGKRVPLHAVLCLAENAVGPKSTRPDDIHVAYSGISVEIVNTDAEGRLALGDGVAFVAKTKNPRVIIDVATLTGAQGIATGKRHGALLTSSAAAEAATVAAGRYSGDLVFPIPYCPEFYLHEFRSAVADMTNNVKDRSNAQASCAGELVCGGR